MPKKKKSAKRAKSFYKSKPPAPERGVHAASIAKTKPSPERTHTSVADTRKRPEGRAPEDFLHAIPISPSHFQLRDDGSIKVGRVTPCAPSPENESAAGSGVPALPELIFSTDHPFLRLYHGNCLELLDAIAAKYPEGRFDAIFADPPYFLSNGGITCHAGKMVKVDKGDWDISRGHELNHEFNCEWLARCQKVLKPNGTLWVSGTHHVIFSIGYAMQQLGYKILNDIAWEKPNPPPNLSCRYFTHSTETILWAAKNEKSKHLFNYQEMRKVTGKQMKTVWRSKEFLTEDNKVNEDVSDLENGGRAQSGGSLQRPSFPSFASVSNLWTLSAPGNGEKTHGKHPTQKPVALIERCLLASTNEGDLVLDPFLGGGTTAIAAIKLKRGCVGVEADLAYISLSVKRVDREIISIWLRHFKVRVEISVTGRAGHSVPAANPSERRARSDAPYQQNDLDLASETINGSRRMADVPQIETERIYHECKFVFLSAAQVERGAVVHTTVDVSLQEAWAKTPNGKKRETTHVVRCETEIFRVKSH